MQTGTNAVPSLNLLKTPHQQLLLLNSTFILKALQGILLTQGDSISRWFTQPKSIKSFKALYAHNIMSAYTETYIYENSVNVSFMNKLRY
jgi:hypothetical protein